MSRSTEYEAGIGGAGPAASTPGPFHASAVLTPSLVDLRDQYLNEHQRQTRDIAVAVAEILGLTDDQIDALKLAAVCHDLGMIHVPPEIVMKAGALTATEYGIIQTHAEIGSAMLGNVEFAWPISQIVIEHHERYDGTGYPGKLAGENISIEARVLTVADAFDAMTSSRPYRPALGHQAALLEVREGRGRFFDPAAADALIVAYAERRFASES